MGSFLGASKKGFANDFFLMITKLNIKTCCTLVNSVSKKIDCRSCCRWEEPPPFKQVQTDRRVQKSTFLSVLFLRTLARFPKAQSAFSTDFGVQEFSVLSISCRDQNQFLLKSWEFFLEIWGKHPKIAKPFFGLCVPGNSASEALPPSLQSILHIS